MKFAKNIILIKDVKNMFEIQNNKKFFIKL